VATGATALMLGLTLLHTNVSAFGGYAHHNICDRVIKNDFSKINTAYLSGATIADIGLFNWDEKYSLESDSQKFASKTIEITSKSEDAKEKYFALGWSDHVIQNEKGSAWQNFR
jgi:hypothetical protein